MYEVHDAFTPPDDPETIIWRYVSVPQFIDMLERHALWFTQLGSLDDPFEGVPHDETLRMHRERNDYLRALLVEKSGMSAERAEAWPAPPVSHPRDFAYANCWHMNAYESLAMWNTYGDKGIAIRSTFNRLAQSFREVPQPIFIGAVTYRDRRDPRSADDLLGNLLRFATRKGMSYEHERELRAVATQAPIVDFPLTFAPGIRVEPVNLGALIDSVYVAPGTPGWIKELVRRILDRYRIDKELVDSDFEARPDLT